MKKQTLKTKDSWGLQTLVLAGLLFAVVFTVVTIGLSNTSETVCDEGVRVAEEAIMRGVVSCYAVEGAYPESYEYLCENYGVAVNEDKYTVHYNAFASNILPEVTVIAKGGNE
jgi:hypothetical protein